MFKNGIGEHTLGLHTDGAGTLNNQETIEVLTILSLSVVHVSGEGSTDEVTS